MDRSTEFDTEDFSEFFTNILITSFQIVDSLILNSHFRHIGKHSSTIDSASGSRPEDLLDNFEFAAALNGLSFGNDLIGRSWISPETNFCYQSYENGKLR